MGRNMSCTPDVLPKDFLTTSITETSKGVACISAMYYAHLMLAYLVVLAGALALITRVVPQWRRYHSFFGLSFMLIMYFTEGSGMLIFNTGLPRAIIFFLTLMLVSMTSGFCAIRAHIKRRREQVLARAEQLQSRQDNTPLRELVKEAGEQLSQQPRTWRQRLFSLKALHGYLMALAWYQMAGRAMVVNPFASYDGCYAYPVYKSLGEDGELGLLPPVSEEDIDSQIKLATFVTIPIVILFAVIGISYALIASWWSQRTDKKYLEE